MRDALRRQSILRIPDEDPAVDPDPTADADQDQA
jgi:hypothetical protein